MARRADVRKEGAWNVGEKERRSAIFSFSIEFALIHILSVIESVSLPDHFEFQ